MKSDDSSAWCNLQIRYVVTSDSPALEAAARAWPPARQKWDNQNQPESNRPNVDDHSCGTPRRDGTSKPLNDPLCSERCPPSRPRDPEAEK